MAIRKDVNRAGIFCFFTEKKGEMIIMARKKEKGVSEKTCEVCDTLLKTNVRTFLPMVLSIIIGVVCSCLGNWSPEQSGFYIKITVFGVTCILLLALIVFYVFYDPAELESKKIESQNKMYEDALASISQICAYSAAQINTIAHDIKTNGSVDLRLWSFNDVCQQICVMVYKMLQTLRRDKDFKVTFMVPVEYTENKDKITAIKMVGFGNRSNTRPKNYAKKIQVDLEADKCNRFDAKLFCLYQADIVVFATEKEVSQNLKKTKKYKQYLAIPVFCDDRKMVGLLQIATTKPHNLGRNENEIFDLANKIMKPLTNFLLLSYKVEKGLISVPDVNILSRER